MHTLKATHGHHELRVHFNSDWSGNATVSAVRRGDPDIERELSTPGALVVDLAKQIVARITETERDNAPERSSKSAAIAAILAKLTPHEVGELLRAHPHEPETSRSLPNVAYAWHTTDAGTWVREDADEFGAVCAAVVATVVDSLAPTGFVWRGPHYDPAQRSGEVAAPYHPRYATADEAKAAYDRYLVENDWLLDDTATTPDDEHIPKRTY